MPALPPRWKQPAVLLAALAAGWVMGLSFAPVGWWPLAITGVASLVWLSRLPSTGRGTGLVGYLFGIGLFTPTVSYVAVMGWWVGVLIVAAMSLWTLGLAVANRRVQRLRAWPLWVACTWSLAEFCWSRFPFGGFGWDRLAFTTPDQPMGGYLHLVGAAGTGFLVALAGALLAALAQPGARRVRRAGLAGGIVAILLVGGVLRLVPIPETDDDQTVAVGVVQGNVDGSAGPRTMGYARSVTNNHLSETITLLARARTGVDPMPDVVLWPENSTDLDPRYDEDTRWAVDTAAKLADRPILVGAVMEGPGEGERQTSSLWWEAGEGIQARYDKQNAVPFGEFTPLKSLVFALVPMARGVGSQTVEGDEPGAIDVTVAGRQVTVGPIICYELAFDQTVYETTTNGAQLIAVQSNNATYTGTNQPLQQFQITRVRAMEMGREIVVATTSSFSGLIAADGSVLARSEEATAAAQTFVVSLSDTVTPGVRIGPWFELVAALAGLVTAILGWPRRAATEAAEPDSGDKG
ncbi:apolipoprotein N-acyltransferase [Brooklawnia cerclae]|uniref:Apolipoprotein N-acyltransferase n=1 Tax=Brooklawnia cerclae TaxID=349934 RepID=A0ABX0SED4_9ACTN|nr:apolipoprotein N-acyltransferase [Brooklawnia cerclae]